MFGTIVLSKSKCNKSTILVQMLRQSGATRPVIMSFCPCATRKPLGHIHHDRDPRYRNYTSAELPVQASLQAHQNMPAP